ncbi:hypothetical protein [Brevundimonas sp.]|uniref:hypothetical protein n=1 Tax=Brevundimonas sp. TaxID=1871086 RepID=UPI002ABB3D55|nr:hypothetical protein [Brevundimonas sp.]MDZ4364682.1 hypothetical protein [Brevundimonas sp.]
MTVTYTDDLKPSDLHSDREEPVFTPVYARGKSRRNKPVKTWMILAPIGALVLGGSALAMMMAPASESTIGQAEPATDAMTTPLSAPLASIPEPVAMTPEPVAAPAPVPAMRAEAAPAPVRRAAPASRAAAPATAPARVATPAEQTGPRPYTSEATPDAAPTAPAITPAAPSISVQPLG